MGRIFCVASVLFCVARAVFCEPRTVFCVASALFCKGAVPCAARPRMVLGAPVGRPVRPLKREFCLSNVVFCVAGVVFSVAHIRLEIICDLWLSDTPWAVGLATSSANLVPAIDGMAGNVCVGTRFISCVFSS